MFSSNDKTIQKYFDELPGEQLSVYSCIVLRILHVYHIHTKTADFAVLRYFRYLAFS